MHPGPELLERAFFLPAGVCQRRFRRLAPVMAARPRAVGAQHRERQNAPGFPRGEGNLAARPGHGAHRHFVFRQRAGFVRADHARAAERLHRGHPPDDAFLGRHPPHAHRQHDRDHGGKALRDGRHREADREKKHVKRRRMLKQSDEKDNGADHQRARAEPAARLCQALLQRRFRRLLRGDQSRDPSDLRAHAGVRDHAQRVPRRDRRGGKDHVSPVPHRRVFRQDGVRVLFGGQAFAGQRAFVGAQPVRLKQPQIRRGHVPRPQAHHVARHQLRRVHRFLVSAADHPRSWAAQPPQSLHRVLRPALLNQARHRVDDDDGQNNNGIHIVVRPLDPRGQKRDCRRRKQDEHHKIRKLRQKPHRQTSAL